MTKSQKFYHNSKTKYIVYFIISNFGENMNLFGTDGIRGIAGEFLTPKLCYNIGKALAVVASENKNSLHRPRIMIAGDTRTSTDFVKHALIAGALAHGADVIDAGILPTPAVSVLANEFDFGVMITASHNPPQYNGIKIFDTTGNKLNDESIKKLEYVLKNQTDFGLQTFDKMGEYTVDENLRLKYIEKIANNINIDLSNYNVALDCANGACCACAEEVFKRLNAKVVAFNNTANGIDINTNCGALHPEFLQNSIKLGKFDIGFAFDGDGDRVICVLNDGEIVDGDKIMYALAVLMKEMGVLYGNTLVATILTNFGVEHSLNKRGITVKRVQVGDKNVSICLQNEKLPLGGEKAGHIIISDFAKTGDGIYSALYMLKLLKILNKTPQEILQGLKIYPAIEINVPVQNKDKNEVLRSEKLLDAIDRAQTLLSDGGRLVVRASGTENKIRILVEGEDETLINDIATYLHKTILQLL